MNSGKVVLLANEIARARKKNREEWNVSAVYANRHNESTTTPHQKVGNRRALYL